MQAYNLPSVVLLSFVRGPVLRQRNSTICPTVQAVSSRLPTAAARVRSQVRSCECCGGQSGTMAVFLQVLPFLLPILIPPTAPYSLIFLSSTLCSLDTDSVFKQQTSKKRLTPWNRIFIEKLRLASLSSLYFMKPEGIHMIPPLYHILSNMDPNHTLTSNFLKSILTLFAYRKLGLTRDLFLSDLPTKI
jgi:hypothetical protein